ncbi:MAG: hypothetical protein KJ711_06840, partial [Candidatus Omnitrophica bacterium]|nr:hypothetical protein [Candidatus Omnitrophota bacterium]
KVVKKYSVSLNGEAKISQLGDFVFKIESPPTLVIVEECSIKPQTKKSGLLNFTMTISKIIIP